MMGLKRLHDPDRERVEKAIDRIIGYASQTVALDHSSTTLSDGELRLLSATYLQRAFNLIVDGEEKFSRDGDTLCRIKSPILPIGD